MSGNLNATARTLSLFSFFHLSATRLVISGSYLMRTERSLRARRAAQMLEIVDHVLWDGSHSPGIEWGSLRTDGRMRGSSLPSKHNVICNVYVSCNFLLNNVTVT